MHCVNYGDKAPFVSGSKYCEQELGRLEAIYLKVFSEPMYPIWQNR